MESLGEELERVESDLQEMRTPGEAGVPVKKRPEGALPAGGPPSPQQPLPGNEQPVRATPGSAGVDLCAASGLILTPEMGVQLIETSFKGPLPPNTVGLLLGRSSVALRGLTVVPGVIDSDYMGKVKIMAQSLQGTLIINKGDRIAQLLILPSLHGQYPAKQQSRGAQGFGSTGENFIGLHMTLQE
ncbi:deoxyuridine 5'-triphosphate nucleotidohydrolase-like [Cavia porcellus]|uniref:deoxyuridine 5'-triphosphate nucleotidohydrolase-like n=1 Tax=Cavia porcellus TaxID=10141 RepID=UPI000661A1F6|nr:uncharacterized protein LOC106026975 [Cavia porcellus]